jgi:RimJ/RimL family protein N-acetyltransferase
VPPSPRKLGPGPCTRAVRERADGNGLSVVIEADGELAGTGGLYLRPGRLGPEIGYTVAPWARGRGYAAGTARAPADWGLAHGAARVHLFVDVDNAASGVAARRAGFVQEGFVRACLERRDGGRADAALFSRVAGA